MRLTTVRRCGLALAVPATLALALTGCSATDPQAGSTPTSGATSASTGGGTPAPTAGSQPTRTTPNGPLTFGPAGYGPVTLGLTLKQAKATGIVVNYTPIAANCGHADMLGPDKKVITRRVSGDGMIYFVDSKIVAITAPEGTPTPEGIELGSTRQEFDAAYPSLREVPVGGESTDSYEVTAVPGNPNAEYRFSVGAKADGIVGGIEIVPKGKAASFVWEGCKK